MQILVQKSKRLIKNLFNKLFKRYALIAADITSTCNLRCIYCLNDYEHLKVQPEKRMSRETFQQLIKLLPLVARGRFMLSCEFEPTLHPELEEMIALIPRPYRKKVFLTSNCARPLSDKVVKALAESGFNHLNISLDSLQEKVFESIRIGAKFPVFIDNVKRLVDACKRSPAAPSLRYVTVALKANLAEIPSMVERTHAEFGSSLHEIRYAFNLGHLTPAWRVESLPAWEDWNILEERLHQVPCKWKLVKPPEKTYYDKSGTDHKAEAASSPQKPLDLQDELIGLRCNSAGVVSLLSRENRFMIDIHVLRDPCGFFRAIARLL